MMADEALSELLKTLTATQLDFVRARMFVLSDKAAAQEIGIHEDTVYAWPNIATVRECYKLARMDGVILGSEMLRRLVPEAVNGLEDEMKARRGSSKRLDAIVQVLDRTIGKPTDKTEVSSPGGGPLEIVIRHVEIPIPEHPGETPGATSGS